MNSGFVLNRLRITGKLNDSTPRYVVQEILQSHNICLVKSISSIDELLSSIKTIEKYRPNTLSESLTNHDLRLLATFVNADSTSWTKTALLESYHHMFNFNKEDLSSIIYGQKTYENTHSYNACMLYALCKHHGIETNWRTTPELMLTSLKKLNLSIANLRNQLLSSIEKLNKKSIINLLNYTLISNEGDNNSIIILDETPKIKLPPLLDIRVGDLKESLNKYRDSNYLLRHINPKSHSDAIILAALVFNLNLVESKHPFEEFQHLKQIKHTNLYVPLDSEFKQKYMRNPMWYDLSVNWEPQLSFIYDEIGLRKLCIHEGFEQEDFRQYSYESLLQMSRVSINVFLGKNVYENSETTPIQLLDLSELNNEECLTIGNVETKEFLTYSFNELAEYFSIEKEYRNPAKPTEILDKANINKIHLLATSTNNSKMLNAIEVINKWKKYSNENTEKIRKLYDKNPSIVNFFNLVVDCAMYMRGWKVTSVMLPLTESQTKITNVTNAMEKIETNVSESIVNLLEYVDKLNEDEKRVINELPLMKGSNQEGKLTFIVTPDPDDGASIIERVKMVYEGDKYKNMKSCIRLSSNILLLSCFYYLISLGKPEPFDISLLEYIS